MAVKKATSITAIEAPVPMHEQVYQQIVHALMAGHFEPGQKLTYRKVAEQFGTSPMPVRTAAMNRAAISPCCGIGATARRRSPVRRRVVTRSAIRNSAPAAKVECSV